MNDLLLPSFRSYLLNENLHYLGVRTGDVLSALQDLNDDAAQLGNKALIRACQGIVNQIRRILHGRWDEEDVKYLEKLQKVGVAIMKGIDENEDMAEVIVSSVQELENLIEKLQTPINSLGSEDTSAGEEESVPQQAEEPMARGSELGA